MIEPEEYKPYHHPVQKGPLEEYLNSLYEDFIESKPNPYPFDEFDSEDDYGDESWA